MNFDKAQRDYDRQTPYDNDPKEKDCPTCDTSCVILEPDPTLWQWIKAWVFGIETFITCPTCEGEGFVPETEEDAWDRAAEKADRLRDDEIDRRMGL
jgi:hypothetical protein